MVMVSWLLLKQKELSVESQDEFIPARGLGDQRKPSSFLTNTLSRQHTNAAVPPSNVNHIMGS
jgi:hypothetical protein